jgi:phage terminase large subunit GpA-like protein
MWLGLALPPRVKVSQWADKYRVLSPELPTGGQWRTDVAPFQREAMDIINEPDIDVVVLKWASQLGKSEALNNICGYFMQAEPAPMLFVQPTLEIADNYSDERIKTMIRDSKALSELVGPQRKRQSTDQKRKKSFPGGFLAFAGANSPGSLASRPVRVVLLDEIDKYKTNIGNDGDPIKQAFQRTTNFWNSKKERWLQLQ